MVMVSPWFTRADAPVMGHMWEYIVATELENG